MKLWDMRRTYSNAEGHDKASRRDVPRYHWCACPPLHKLIKCVSQRLATRESQLGLNLA